MHLTRHCQGKQERHQLDPTAHHNRKIVMSCRHQFNLPQLPPLLIKFKKPVKTRDFFKSEIKAPKIAERQVKKKCGRKNRQNKIKLIETEQSKPILLIIIKHSRMTQNIKKSDTVGEASR